MRGVMRWLHPERAPILRAVQRAPYRGRPSHLLPQLSLRVNQLRTSCSGKPRQDERPRPPSPATLTTLGFWTSKSTWRRAAINTFRCLVGCSSGDFAAMWLLQAFYPELGVATIMAVSMASGLSTSMLLETVWLRMGKDQLSWSTAARTATGMSLISMLTMEIAENAVDFHLTGGMVAIDSPAFWVAAVVSMAAGFLAPLPYNYLRLRKYGKACH